MKKLLANQRGGVMILMVLAFMSLGVPVIVSTLRLADTLSVDSQVKTDALRRDYCALAVGEYIRYLTQDEDRWADWWLAHPNGVENIGACGNGAPNGLVIDLDGIEDGGVTTGDEALLGLGLLPPPAYNNRKIQALKTVVANEGSPDKTPFTYTITLINRSLSSVNLNQIRDTLPPDLKYNCGYNDSLVAPDGSITYPMGKDANNLDCDTGGPLGREITWDAVFLPQLLHGESVILTFQAVPDGVSLDTGNYCNVAWAESGGDVNTTTGKTAPVTVVRAGEVAPDNNVCIGGGLGVSVTKTVTPVGNAVRFPSDSDPKTYKFTLLYTITIENIGAEELRLGPGGGPNYGLRDLLPEGLLYVGPTVYIGNDDVTPGDPGTHIDQNDRQRLDWNFVDVIASGETRTLTYTAQADAAPTGAYWSDLLVNFSGEDEVSTYTWPTAGVLVQDDFTVSATIDGRIITDCDVSEGGTDSGDIDCEIS